MLHLVREASYEKELALVRKWGTEKYPWSFVYPCA
jgi:hypothetical protein